MANITLGGNAVTTIGSLPEVNTQAPDFTLTKTDMSDISLQEYKGQHIIMNIFPSVDTGVCAKSIRQFNEEAVELDNTKVLCISKDLPFAQKRFCGAEGIENVEMLSDYRTGDFGRDYGVEFTDGAFKNLHSRAIVVVDPLGKVIYTEQVPEIGEEPNYQAALKALMDA